VRSILPGHLLMIDDGKLRLFQVTQCEDDYFRGTRGLVGGMLSDRKGGESAKYRSSTVPPLTEKDRTDLTFRACLSASIGLHCRLFQRPMDIIEAQGLIKKTRRHHGKD